MTNRLFFSCFRVAWPKTSFMKASDIWTIGCYTTVFATVAEYCLVLFLVERAKWQERVEERVGWLCFRGRKKIGDDQRRRSGWDSSEGKVLKQKQFMFYCIWQCINIAAVGRFEERGDFGSSPGGNLPNRGSSVLLLI